MIKDGKIFGKINIFDFAILILIVALILVGTLKFRTLDKTVDSSNLGKITYTFLINNVREYTANAFVSGDALYDSSTDVNIGVITNVSATPSKSFLSTQDGSLKEMENPYKYDITLTVETPGTVTDSGYYANKSIELKVGSEKNIETLYAKTLGKIGSIIYSEGE